MGAAQKWKIPNWARGTPITRAHLSSIGERVTKTRQEVTRLLPGSRGNGNDTALAELRVRVETLCDDVAVLLAQLWT